MESVSEKQVKAALPDIQSLGYDELLTERGRLQGIISSKEIELRQLEQMERRLLDSQGDSEANAEKAVKDLTDILGDFSSTILRHAQALLLLDEVKGTHEVHGPNGLNIPDIRDPPPTADHGSEEQRIRLNKRDTVGLDSLFRQLDDVTFNMMICGPKGVGKTTLFHSLFRLTESMEITGKAHISLTEALVTEGPHRLQVTCVQSDSRNVSLLNAHLNELHQNFFTNELRQLVSLGRAPAVDKRVHCCLYLLPPHGCHTERGLKAADISAMKVLAQRVNLIPVIAKADTLTKSELQHYKKKVREAIAENHIQVFQRSAYSETGNSRPFAVASSFGKEGTFKRVYPWGTYDVEDPLLCDFAELRTLLIRTHFRLLLEMTHTHKYGDFKLEIIKDLEVNSLNGGEVGKKKGKKRSTIFRAGQAEKRMFVLSKISDNVRIPPASFRLKKSEALTNELNRKFANKVVHNVGLCIRLFDIVHVGEPFVLPNDGSTYSRVVFRMVVFRPFIGEILVGKIRHCNDKGISVTVGFFDDIQIPAANLQEGTIFNQEEQLWTWQVDENKLYMDLEEDIRFRVSKEVFVETMPVIRDPPSQDGLTVPVATPRQSPYSIAGQINQDGLGLVSWWQTE